MVKIKLATIKEGDNYNDWYIISDCNSWMLGKYYGKKVQAQGYYVKIESAVNAFINIAARLQPSEDFPSLIKYVRELKDIVTEAVQPFKAMMEV